MKGSDGHGSVRNRTAMLAFFGQVRFYQCGYRTPPPSDEVANLQITLKFSLVSFFLELDNFMVHNFVKSTNQLFQCSVIAKT